MSPPGTLGPAITAPRCLVLATNRGGHCTRAPLHASCPASGGCCGAGPRLEAPVCGALRRAAWVAPLDQAFGVRGGSRRWKRRGAPSADGTCKRQWHTEAVAGAKALSGPCDAPPRCTACPAPPAVNALVALPPAHGTVSGSAEDTGAEAEDEQEGGHATLCLVFLLDGSRKCRSCCIAARGLGCAAEAPCFAKPRSTSRHHLPQGTSLVEATACAAWLALGRMLEPNTCRWQREASLPPGGPSVQLTNSQPTRCPPSGPCVLPSAGSVRDQDFQAMKGFVLRGAQALAAAPHGSHSRIALLQFSDRVFLEQVRCEPRAAGFAPAHLPALACVLQQRRRSLPAALGLPGPTVLALLQAYAQRHGHCPITITSSSRPFCRDQRPPTSLSWRPCSAAW